MLRRVVLVVWPHLHVLMVKVVVIDLETHATSAISQATGPAIARIKVMAAERAMEVARDTVAKVLAHVSRRVQNLLVVKISVAFQEEEVKLSQVGDSHHTEVGFNSCKWLCGVARLEHLRAGVHY